VVAGIIALLNDARLRAGKSALGFLNPFIYAFRLQAFNDVVGGGSVGCNGIVGITGEALPGASIIPWASWNATVS
jgi:tripeptidyl-peptidase-1